MLRNPVCKRAALSKHKLDGNSNEKSNSILEINTANIALYKVLKLEGLCSSGGEAKFIIAAGQVSVNGEVETRKRKKIASGDLVQLAGREITIRRTKQVS